MWQLAQFDFATGQVFVAGAADADIPDAASVTEVARLLAAARRPVLILGSDVWLDRAEDAAQGLALGAGGASLFWPLVMSTVSRRATQVVSAVGTFTAAGYIGWVAGAPVVGWVSQSLG